jgi:hypothetical protein
LGNAANTRNPSFAFSAPSRSGNLAKPVTHTPRRDPQASSANHPLLREKPLKERLIGGGRPDNKQQARR